MGGGAQEGGRLGREVGEEGEGEEREEGGEGKRGEEEGKEDGEILKKEEREGVELVDLVFWSSAVFPLSICSVTLPLSALLPFFFVL